MDGAIVMEKFILDLIGNPYVWVITGSFGVNVFLAKGWFKCNLKSSSSSEIIKDKDRDLDRLKSEIKTIQENADKSISNIQKEHEDIVDKLNSQIKALNDEINDSHSVLSIPFKSMY